MASRVLQITGPDEAKAGRREHRKCHSRLPLTTTPQARFGVMATSPGPAGAAPLP